MLIGPHRQIKNLQTFPFTGNMDKRGFGYDGISDKITSHGRSHLSLLRESYQKSGLIIAINLKVTFTASLCLCWLLSFLSISGFCLFFLFWLLSFLPFVKYRWEVSHFLHTFFFFFITFSLSSTLFPLTSFHFPLSSTNIFSCSIFFH